jgi:hypothetical protein
LEGILYVSYFDFATMIANKIVHIWHIFFFINLDWPFSNIGLGDGGRYPVSSSAHVGNHS